MSMGYEPGVHVNPNIHRGKWQRHQGVIAGIGRILDGRTRTRIVKHGVHKKGVAAVFDNHRGMTDKAQAHIHFVPNTSFAASTVLQ
jgi:hypothetical protein